MKKCVSLLACLILVIIVTLSCLISKDNTNNLNANSKGTLAVYLDGKPADELPGIETKYRFESIECENGGTAYYDYVNEKLNVSLSNTDSCNVYYNGKYPIIDDGNVTFYSDGELIVYEHSVDILMMMLESFVYSEMYPLSGDYVDNFMNNDMYHMYGLFGRQWDQLCFYMGTNPCSTFEEFVQEFCDYGYITYHDCDEASTQIQKLLKHFPVITKVTFEEGITKIGAMAFDSFGDIELDIPDTIVTIENHAFSQSKIKVDLSNCSELTTIKSYAFVMYTGEEIIFPTDSSLTTIEKNAFTYIDNYQQDLIIPDSVESIGTSAFSNSTIPKLVLPNNYNYYMIEESTFYNANIAEIIVPDNIYKIHSTAFKNLSSESTIYLAYPKTDYVNENGDLFDFTGLNVVENYTE